MWLKAKHIKYMDAMAKEPGTLRVKNVNLQGNMKGTGGAYAQQGADVAHIT